MKAFRDNGIVIGLYFLVSYPMFYYAYKFGSPDFGNRDFYNYYHLYKSWDFENVISPFNTRLISSFFIYLFNKLDFFYNSEISYSHPLVDKQVFFNAIFFNYLSLVMTAYVIYHTIKLFFANKLLSFVIGLTSFLGFGALFYSLNTLTESFSILLFALIFLFYLQRSYWIFPFLLLAVIQREYIFFIMGLISLIHIFFDKQHRKFYVHILISSVICFVIYFVLRKTFFFTQANSAQLEPSNILNRLLNPGFPIGEYLRQSLLNQNILLLYIAIVVIKWIKHLPFNKVNLFIVFALYLQAHFISIITVLGNSCGRYFYITLPILLYYIANELKPLIRSHLSFEKNE